MFDVFPSEATHLTEPSGPRAVSVEGVEGAQHDHGHGGGGARHELIVALASALHRCGTASDELEDQLRDVAAALGVSAQFFATPTAMFIQLGRGAQSETRLVRVDPPQMDLGRTSRVAAIVKRLLVGETTVDHALDELGDIERAPPLYGELATAMGFALTGGAAARLFGGGIHEILVSAVVGTVVGGLAVVAPRLRASVTRLFEPVAALIAAALAVLVCAIVRPTDPQIVTLTSLIVLLPGLSLTQAMSELAVRNLASGTARFMGAATVLLMIAFGVALGRGLVGPIAETLSTLPPIHLMRESTPLPAWTEWVALALAAVSLVVLLSAELRDTPLVFFALALGMWSERLGTMALGPELGASLGALALGLFANAMGRWRDRPPATLLIPGLLLLVPGSLGLRSLDAMMGHELMRGIGSAFTTALVATSLVAGLLVANAALPPVSHRHRAPPRRP